ncbi:N-acetylmuramoyl-L-alanine amidase [uncultured Deefgea sp.]|uniref:N-acetylmuramoyl-L-alanine amidase n=1 Tax=uncultured Deefgea sp. TaxID=1304914 RepID=UPI0025915BF3|nr:N-acetylmuramoyl-L-alanine amidase [uncultured Deefgea sp.]
MSRNINQIVIHCAASQNGKRLGDGKRKTAAGCIDVWHSARGFKRAASARAIFNPTLFAVGYHFVIDTDGTKETGRSLDEIGAHVAGHNTNSVGVCLVGTDRFTKAQWDALSSLIRGLQLKYPVASIVGHRDLSPDLNRDGKITPNEFTKICPGFTVAEWLASGMLPLRSNMWEG